MKEGERVALLGYGYGVRVALDAAAILAEHDLSVTVADARFAKPLDEELIERLAAEHELVVTIEENVLAGRVRLRQCSSISRTPSPSDPAPGPG